MNMKQNAGHATMRRRAAAAFAAALMTVGIAVTATPASAATWDCPSGATCVWGSTNYNTNGSGTALVWFQQCVSNYIPLNYAGTSSPAGFPGGWAGWPHGYSKSMYNNGNYETVQMYNAVDYNGYYGTYRLGKKTGDYNIDDNVGAARNQGYWGPLSGIFDTVSKSCRN